MKKFLLIFLLTVRPLFATESIRYEEVSVLPAFYRMVTVCGKWESKSGSGYRRVVLTDVYSGAASELYVQTVSDPTQEKDAQVLNTIKISELNNEHSRYSIESVRCKPVSDGLRLEVEASNEHDETDKVHRFVISVFGADKYSVTRVTKFSQAKGAR